MSSKIPVVFAGATIAACPVLVANILAPEASQSFAALLVGFALSEMWRAPAAIMIRDVSPPNLGSTGSAVHLCVRNLVGGLGPLSASLLLSQPWRLGLVTGGLVLGGGWRLGCGWGRGGLKHILFKHDQFKIGA